MDIAVIFVNYKTKYLTINAIKSILKKTQEINYKIFVINIDNNYQDSSIKTIKREFPNINIIKNSIYTRFEATNNFAIKQAKGKYIFCLNINTLLINNVIKIMYDFRKKTQ